MFGAISNISVAGMLRLLCNYKKTGVLYIEGEDKKGFIEISTGEIVDVQIKSGTKIGENKKEEIIELLLVLENGTFYFEEKEIKNKKPLDICPEDVILETSRKIYKKYKNIINIRDFLFPENEILKIANIPPDKILKITFISDEWNLLIKFTGDNNIKTVINDSKLEKEKIECILYGLISAGLIRRTRFKVPEISKIAREYFGNIGVAIVDKELSTLKIDKTRMGMRDFINLLNNLEKSFAEIVGKTKAKMIVEKIWEETK